MKTTIDGDTARDAIRAHGGPRKAARATGIPESSLRTAAKRSADGGEQFNITEAGDETTIICTSRRIKTADEAIAEAKIDLRLWEIIEKSVNSWEVAGKLRGGQDNSNRWKPEKLWIAPLWQIKIKLRRKAPRAIQQGIAELVCDLKPPKLKFKTIRTRPNDLLLEVALFDAHFGKLAWDASTQDGDYDLEIAEQDFAKACDGLLALCPDAVRKIIFPVGNDFFQADDWSSKTAGGTQVDSVDDRFQKVFQVGCRAVRNALLRCRQQAAVEVLWIPGNHDRSTSWYLAEYLAAWFRNDKHVSVDSTPPFRKYRRHGVNLLGYTHGNDIKLDRLPLLMAVESAKDFAESKFRAWRIGHFHKRAQTHYVAGDTHNGVLVEILPSLSGTDQWHYDRGYVKNSRTAEAHLWCPRSGRIAIFSKTVGSET